jgi:hypothetical protein
VSERDVERIHEQGEREADDMERRGEALDEEKEKARADWDAKKSDGTVPGAQPDDDSGEGPPPEADITPGD